MPNFGNVLSASFWTVPLALVAAAAALALGLVELDERLGESTTSSWPLVLSADPETARSMLSTLATTMATIAATTFSLTLVALTLAAQQYTPKVLHNFLSTRINQVALGVLAGTFAYSVLVLQAVRSSPKFVPLVGLTGALALALASVGVFLYFIHHIASSLQGTSIAADVERRTLQALARVVEGQPGAAGSGEGEPRGGVPVLADASSGYVQRIHIHELVQLLSARDLTLTVHGGVGTFAAKGAPLGWLSPPERATPEVVHKVRDRINLGPDRTHQQDLAFGLYQLVDIAVRSLSPSFNAITTAATCIDHIGSVLRQLATLDLPPWRCYERDGKPRVVLAAPTFEDLLELTFSPIRTSGERHRVILVGLLNVIDDLATVTDQPERRRQLVDHANHIAAAAARGLQAEVDRQALAVRLLAVGDRLRNDGLVQRLPTRTG